MSSSVQLRQREHPDLFALLDPAVVERPRLGPLRARIPLAELVAEAQDAFLGPGALLVAAGAAERGVEPAGLQCIEQGAGLLPVAGGARPGVGHPAGVDGLLHRSDDQLVTVLAEPAVPELDHFVEVVAGVDVQHRKRQREGPKCLLRQPQQHDRVLACGEQQHRPLQLGDDLADDVHRLGFQQPQFLDARVSSATVVISAVPLVRRRRGIGPPIRRSVDRPGVPAPAPAPAADPGRALRGRCRPSAVRLRHSTGYDTSIGSTFSSANQLRQPTSWACSMVMTCAMAPAWYSARASRTGSGRPRHTRVCTARQNDTAWETTSGR